MTDPHAAAREQNRAMWDRRAAPNARSADFGVAPLLADPAALSDVVRFDRPRLGDVAGLRGVHLQCHIGIDTVSLSRLGATMTGLDFSAGAIAEARDLAARTGASTTFVEGTVEDAVNILGDSAFDLVYTGVGALCWLPDIAAWGRTVAALLRPGGRLFLREAHPVLWALDETTDPPSLGYSYFGHDDPVSGEVTGTYEVGDDSFAAMPAHTWNHGLGEIVTALLDAGLTLTRLEEHDSVYWEALPGQMVRDDDGNWRLRESPERLPASYTLAAVKGAAGRP